MVGDVGSTPHTDTSPSLRLEDTDSVAALAPEWTALAAPTGDVFATPEWAEAWLEVLGRGAQLRLVTGRDGSGRLRVLVPLVLTRRGPVRIARLVGHGVADIQGPISAPTDADLQQETLDRALHEVVRDWDVFLGERMLAGRGWGTMPGVRVMHREANPILHLSGWPDWDSFLASRSRKLRREIVHDERILTERHGLVVRRTTDPSALAADLDVMFALHRSRFGDESSFAPREAFHRRFAAVALTAGWLRLWILEIDGRPAAARYDFSYGNVYHAYNGGRDPRWSNLSVGLVLRKHTLEAAFAEGATAYRFLRGDESYKGRFGTVDDPLVTVARSGSWLGRRAVDAAYALRKSVRLRRLVRLRL
jgi:CelD/BcsL family acetyltransferase involved in cellulose biosynthesis